MWRKTAAVILFSSIYGLSFAQLEKLFSVKEECSYDSMHLSVVATSGQCKLGTANHDEALNIYGSIDRGQVKPKFDAYRTHGIKYVNVNLEHTESDVIDMLSGDNKSSQWVIDLNANKIINLQLDYGFGTSDINLSDLKIDKLNINTGSAEVYIKYDKEKWNLSKMDTFRVNVEMGSLITENLLHSKASTYIADVGFGTALLDLSTKNHERIQIKASVGAGSLEIRTPKNDIPTVIYIKQSPLCHIELPKGFKEIRKNTFVNDTYRVDAKNLRSFEIDVALGNITFLPPVVY